MKEIEERKKDFYEKVATIYLNYYPKDMLLEFCEYWTEHNENGRKMRYEKEKTFELNRRLITWKRNAERFNKSTKPISGNQGLFDSLNKALG